MLKPSQGGGCKGKGQSVQGQWTSAKAVEINDSIGQTKLAEQGPRKFMLELLLLLLLQ